MSKRSPWFVRVRGLDRLPVDISERVMKNIHEKLAKWIKDGPDPLVVPDTVELGVFCERWEHAMVECMASRVELRGAIEQHEAEGWQMAAMANTRDGYVLVFKRPKSLQGEPEVKHG